MSEPSPHGDAHPLRRIAANAFFLGAAEVVGRLFSLLAIVHLSRVLLPEGMGVVDLGIALFAVAHNVSRGGVEILAAQQVAEAEGEIRRLAGISLAVSGAWFAAFALLLPLLVVAGAPRPGILVLFALAGIATPLALRFAWWGSERMGVLAASNVVALAAFLLFSLGLVHGLADLWRVGAIWIAVELLRSLAPFLAFLRRHGIPQLRVDARSVREWFVRSAPLTFSRIARGLHFFLDILILGLLAAPAAVGLYGAALRLPRLLTVLGMMFLTSAFPAIVRALAGRDPGEVRALHGLMLRVSLGVAIPCATALVLIAEPLMIVLFGRAFAEAGPLLQIVVWRALLVAIHGNQRNIVLAERPSLDLHLTVLGLLVTGAAVCLLVPHLGAAGAAWGALLGELTLVLGYTAATRQRVGIFTGFATRWALRLAVGLAALQVVSFATASLPASWTCAAVLLTGGLVVLAVSSGDLRLLRRRPATLRSAV